MNDNQLISKIQSLKQIKPNQEWVSLTKQQILGESNKVGFFQVLSQMIYQPNFAYAAITACAVFAVLIGINTNLEQKVQFAQTQTSALLAANQSKNSLDVVSQKLESLVAMVKENKNADIAPAVQDFKESVGVAVKSIGQDIAQNPERLSGIVSQVKAIEDGKKNLETLGIVMTSSNEMVGLNNVLIILVQNEINSLDKANLDDSQKDQLVGIKELYLKGEYTAALEKILLISPK